MLDGHAPLSQKVGPFLKAELSSCRARRPVLKHRICRSRCGYSISLVRFLVHWKCSNKAVGRQTLVFSGRKRSEWLFREIKLFSPCRVSKVEQVFDTCSLLFTVGWARSFKPPVSSQVGHGGRSPNPKESQRRRKTAPSGGPAEPEWLSGLAEPASWVAKQTSDMVFPEPGGGGYLPSPPVCQRTQAGVGLSFEWLSQDTDWSPRF